MRTRFTLFCFAVAFLWLSGNARAQELSSLPGFGIEANAFAGKVIKHTATFHLPVPELTTGLDIDLQWKTYGKADWQQHRRYPTIGIGFTYTNYGIDSIYGRCFSIYPNIIVPLITGKRFQWTIRIGDGAGYVTRRYMHGKPSDTINNAIGSHVNDYASFLSDVRYHVNDHLDLQLGVNFSHISNASYQQPNLGINLAGVHIGVRYFPVTSSPKRIVRALNPLSKRWLFQYRLTLAHDGSNAPLGPSYPIYLGTAYVSKRWISKNKVFGGIDYSYHTNIDAFLHNNAGNGFVTPGTEAAHSYKSALFAGNEFLLGRLGVVLQVGYYIHQAFQVQGKVYEKIGGNLYLVQREHGPIKEFFLCGYLKTHLSVAELAEFGFGMGF
jgi:hypothetical protein